jgi:hypothetical protein
MDVRDFVFRHADLYVSHVIGPSYYFINYCSANRFLSKQASESRVTEVTATRYHLPGTNVHSTPGTRIPAARPDYPGWHLKAHIPLFR